MSKLAHSNDETMALIDMNNAVENGDVKVWCEYPPIPDRSYDWGAAEDGYEDGGPIGWGATKDAALMDLHEQIATD